MRRAHTAMVTCAIRDVNPRNALQRLTTKLFGCFSLCCYRKHATVHKVKFKYRTHKAGSSLFFFPLVDTNDSFIESFRLKASSSPIFLSGGGVCLVYITPAFLHSPFHTVLFCHGRCSLDFCAPTEWIRPYRL